MTSPRATGQTSQSPLFRLAPRLPSARASAERAWLDPAERETYSNAKRKGHLTRAGRERDRLPRRSIVTGATGRHDHGPRSTKVPGKPLWNVDYLHRSAQPQPAKPCEYLLVVVQEPARGVRREINAVQEVERPPCEIITDKVAIGHPVRRPSIGVIPSQPPLSKSNKSVFDLVKRRLDIHAPSLRTGTIGSSGSGAASPSRGYLPQLTFATCGDATSLCRRLSTSLRLGQPRDDPAHHEESFYVVGWAVALQAPERLQQSPVVPPAVNTPIGVQATHQPVLLAHRLDEAVIFHPGGGMAHVLRSAIDTECLSFAVAGYWVVRCRPIESITTAWWKSVWVSTPPTNAVSSAMPITLSFRATHQGWHAPPVEREDKTVTWPWPGSHARPAGHRTASSQLAEKSSTGQRAPVRRRSNPSDGATSQSGIDVSCSFARHPWPWITAR